MAYVSQEMKAVRAPKIRELLKQYGLKGSLSVISNSTLCLTITSGPLDFIGDANRCNMKNAHMRGTHMITVKDYLDVNTYYIDTFFSGRVAEFLQKAVNLLKGSDYYDDTDVQSDYFNCSHYVSIKIGKWNKPYVLTER